MTLPSPSIPTHNPAPNIHLYTHPIATPHDLLSLSPNSWLTDSPIREILRRFLSSTHTSPQIHLLDPSFLSNFSADPSSIPSSFFEFLYDRRRGWPIGLVLPLNIPFGDVKRGGGGERGGGDHWIVYYLNIEERGAICFDSLRPPPGSPPRGLPLILQLYQRLVEEYESKGSGIEVMGYGTGRFRVEIDRGCAQQGDGSSCGVYMVRNCLDLMERRRPSGEVLGEREIERCREVGRRVLGAILKGDGDRDRDRGNREGRREENVLMNGFGKGIGGNFYIISEETESPGLNGFDMESIGGYGEAKVEDGGGLDENGVPFWGTPSASVYE